MLNRKLFIRNLLEWYHLNKRDLPWRNTDNAYVIWLSEVILQQTRVNQGLPYFNRFLEEYPDINKLAAAEEQEILRLWQGLGYYSRAKNLHAAAKNIVEERQGNFPESYNKLLSLKGVGKYTAAAIASFAFNERVAVVDGNVYRVISRVFGMFDDIGSPAGQRSFQKFADTILPERDVATYNQAIMEFGALHCAPGQPLCEECVMKTFCFANKNGIQNELPVKTRKVKIRTRYFNYLVIRHQDKLLMKKRSHKDIWNGLYDFFMVETSGEEDIYNLDSEPLINLFQHNKTLVKDVSKLYKHILTHQHLYVRFFLIDLADSGLYEQFSKSHNISAYTIEEVKELPKPILIDNYLSDNIF